MAKLSESNPKLAAGLTSRFVSRFLRRWPEGGLTAEEVEQNLSISREEEHGELCLTVGFGVTGSVTTIGWDGSDSDAASIVEGIADNLAQQAEADRWTAGDGWREYRS